MAFYYTRLAASFVRGRCAQGERIALPEELRTSSLTELSEEQLGCIIQTGLDAGLKLHKFKCTMGLARAARVFGMLRSIAPKDLLDIGSGRGAFLWPLLDGFPDLPVTAIDVRADRARDLQAVRLGGIERLTVCRADVAKLCFGANTFDVTTMLEVLEHIPAAQQALAQVVLATRRFVVFSVPSKPDDNPEHVHLFDEHGLRHIFCGLNVRRVAFDYVPGHIVGLANVGA